jgi:Fe-S oxidoreductase
MGYKIISMQPACSYMLKVEYPWLADEEGARAVSDATMDLTEYLASLYDGRLLDMKFSASPGKMLYHVACHVRPQGLGSTCRDILGLIPGAEIRTLEACSGMGGRWGLSKGNHAASLARAQPLFDGIGKHQSDCVVSDCARAALQIRQGTGRNVLHPAEVLRYAYGLSLDV